MAGPKEIPELVNELVDLSKEYLRQETIEPAKKLGKFGGMRLGAAVLTCTAAFLLTLGFFALMRRLLPDTQWWAVAARLLTFLGAGAAAGIIGWRMSRDGD
jgi:hypothetical protein